VPFKQRDERDAPGLLSANDMAAWTFGSMEPGANCFSSIYLPFFSCFLRYGQKFMLLFWSSLTLIFSFSCC